MAVDELSQDFLRVLLENNGRADTTTIRSETGMSRGQVNHRFQKLEDLDWIEITRAESGKGERTPPKVAVLTDEGDQAIRNGSAGKNVLEKDTEQEEEVKVSKEQIQEFHNEIDGVKNRLNVVVEQLNDGTQEHRVEEEEVDQQSSSVSVERVEEIEREVARLRETVELLNEAVSEENSGSSDEETQGQNQQIEPDVIQQLKDEQDYLEEWMDVAQKHMVAMRMYMRENDENFDKYLQKANEKEEN